MDSFMRLVNASVSLISMALLSACGGGGSSGVRLSSSPIAVQDTSYLNFKNTGMAPQSVPGSVSGNGTTTRAYADFSRTGNFDLITATITYNPAQPIANATPSSLKYWKVTSNGTFIEDTTKLNASAGCLHPRKALVADFNSDGIADVFLTCHGYDAGNFPGEKNKILLSQANGTFSLSDASADVGFWHGATALDVNADGAIDVVAVTGGHKLATFINDGRGRFSLEAEGRFPTMASGGYYSIEAVDINGDGKKDILLGGHEMDGATTFALINPGNFYFGSVAPLTLPALAGQGVVLDFVVTGAGPNALIWVLRTGDRNRFYMGKTIQKISYSDRTSSIALQDLNGNWTPWIIPTVISGIKYIATDVSDANFKISY